MEQPVETIAVVQGLPSADVQDLFRDFVDRWQGSARIAGLIETPRIKGSKCLPGQLRRIVDGRDYALFQDLGSNSTSCGLDGAGAIAAGESIRDDIAGGCDLVILSKFGKLEAESRSGLIAAFTAAIEAGIPVLTSVSPKYEEAWSRFAAPMFVTLPGEAQAVDRWWNAVRQLESAGFSES